MKTLILVIVLAMIGIGCYALIDNPVDTTNNGAGGTQLAFGEDLHLSVGETTTLADGLSITLSKINDSRCKSGVQCIWQGELGVELVVTGGGFGDNLQSINLGTVRSPAVGEGGYTFTLKSATERGATIVVKVD